VKAAGGYSSGWFVPTETTVTEIAPGVWFRKTQWEPTFIGCNQGWIIFDDFVLVIDASFPNQAEEIIPLIRKTTDKPIRFVFDTHYHGEMSDITLLDKQRRYFVELRQYIGDAIAKGQSLAAIKKTIDFPWYKEWTGVSVRDRAENIEHVYKELGGK